VAGVVARTIRSCCGPGIRRAFRAREFAVTPADFIKQSRQDVVTARLFGLDRDLKLLLQGEGQGIPGLAGFFQRNPDDARSRCALGHPTLAHDARMERRCVRIHPASTERKGTVAEFDAHEGSVGRVVEDRSWEGNSNGGPAS
jgi:hypothetical protein